MCPSPFGHYLPAFRANERGRGFFRSVMRVSVSHPSGRAAGRMPSYGG